MKRALSSTVACLVAVAFATGAAGGSAAPAAGSLAADGPTAAAVGPSAGAAGPPAADTLIVEDAATGEVILAIPVAEGTNVTLAYTHSVEKTPVRDVYAVRDDRLEMVRMEFNSYGAGLPSGANVTETDNGSYAFDPEGSYEEIYVQPGEVAGHSLLVDGQSYDLVALTNERPVRLHLVNACAAGPTAAPNGTDASGVSQP